MCNFAVYVRAVTLRSAKIVPMTHCVLAMQCDLTITFYELTKPFVITRSYCTFPAVALS